MFLTLVEPVEVYKRISSIRLLQLKLLKNEWKLLHHIWVIAECFKFYSFTRSGSFLKEALRYGASSSQIQTKLLLTVSLTWEAACKAAQSFQLANNEQQRMCPSALNNVNNMNYKKKAKTTCEKKAIEKCPKCTNHGLRSCPTKDWNCFTCGKNGHASKAWRSKGKGKEWKYSS